MQKAIGSKRAPGVAQKDDDGENDIGLVDGLVPRVARLLRTSN
jgi:hypothetical protein